MEEDELASALCAENPLDRAFAYREVMEQHGWENFDSYPVQLTKAQAKQWIKRYCPTPNGRRDTDRNVR